MKGKVRRIKKASIPTLDARAIGSRIAEARKSRDWRQQDLADASGIGFGAIVGFENGLRIPSTRSLNALSAALKRKTDWILFGKRYMGSGKRPVQTMEDGLNRTGRPGLNGESCSAPVRPFEFVTPPDGESM